MKKNNRLFVILLSLVVLINIVSCTSNSKEKVKETVFLETEIELPEIESFFSLSKSDDNSLVLLFKNSEDVLEERYLPSVDGNKDLLWMEANVGSQKEEENSILYDENMKKNCFVAYDISRNGDRLIAYFDKSFIENNYENLTIQCKTILSDDSEIETKIDSKILNNSEEIKYAYNGDIYFISDSYIYQYDKSGENLKYTYDLSSKENSILSVCTNSDYLVVVTNKYIVYYDMNTGQEIKKIDKLGEYIDDKVAIFKGNSSKEIVLSNSKGLYKYNLSKDEMKEIFTSSSNSLGNNDLVVKQIIEIPNDYLENDSEQSSYLIVYQNIHDNSFKLYKYSYSEELSNSEKELISIYSLYENEIIKYFIRIYQNKNPNVKIKYEVGIKTYGSITETDAIKKLNSDIMAGKGPDILFLDGINSDYYEEKGLLEDISDIVNDKKSVLFNEITDCYYNRGKVFKIPLSFNIPLLIGESDIISKIDNLDSLNTEIKDNYNDISTQLMYIYEPEDIINLFYYMSSGDFINDDKLNKDTIRKYLKTTKEIYKSISSKTPEENYKYYSENRDQYISMYGEKLKYSQGVYLFKLLSICDFVIPDLIKLDVGYSISLEELSELTSVVNQRGDLSYKFFAPNGKKTFMPSLIVSLNSKSKNKDLGKKIISEFFNEDYQRTTTYGIGYPININALEGIYAENIGNDKLGSLGKGTKDGGTVMCETSWLSEEEYNNLLSIIKEVEEPVNTNTDILDPLTIAAKKYFNDEMTLEEAMDYISEKMKIKLEE